MHERRPWTQQQDDLIKNQVLNNKQFKWSKILQSIKRINPDFSRTSKQIRQRQISCKQHPQLKNDAWSPEQQEIVFKSHMIKGSKWKQIQKLLPGRSEKSIKNFFYMTLRKSLRRVTKILGARNSTNQTRELKPQVLTKLVQTANQKPQKRQSIYRLFQLHKIKNSDCRKLEINQQDTQIYRELVDDILKFNELYTVNKKQGLQILQQNLSSLKSVNLGYEKGKQNSIAICCSTVPSELELDQSQLQFQMEEHNSYPIIQNEQHQYAQKQYSIGLFQVQQQSSIFQKQ